MNVIKVNSPFEVGRTDIEEIADLTTRAHLMLNIRDVIDHNKWSQKQAATVLRTTQPRISSLKNGEASEFSVGMLITFLVRLGYTSEVTSSKDKIQLELKK
ncbi:MAG: XRE family transcriptional regulator [Robiginitomaculum sp.]|nr:MAG: XRE family transcriptional regulator [Robiginitomaculum sp.]